MDNIKVESETITEVDCSCSCNCKCDNVVDTEKEILKAKLSFKREKLNESLKEFYKYWKEKYPDKKCGFKEDIILREFIEFLLDN